MALIVVMLEAVAVSAISRSRTVSNGSGGPASGDGQLGSRKVHDSLRDPSTRRKMAVILDLLKAENSKSKIVTIGFKRWEQT